MTEQQDATPQPSRVQVSERVTAGSALAGRLRKLASRHIGVSILLAGYLLFAVSYLVVLMVAQPSSSFGTQTLGAINNSTSAFLVALAVMATLRSFVIGRSLQIQILAHCLLAPVTTLLWYIAVIVGIGIRTGSMTRGFDVNPFPPGAMTWQIFQGFYLYAAIAAASYAVEYRREARQAKAQLDERMGVLENAGLSKPDQPRHLILKQGSEFHNVELSEIVAVLASDDYAEIITGTRRFLKRQSLSDLLETLPANFLRIHRSKVVNREKILSAEPAGDGRLSIHLEGGHTLTTSRSGARLFKQGA